MQENYAKIMVGESDQGSKIATDYPLLIVEGYGLRPQVRAHGLHRLLNKIHVVHLFFWKILRGSAGDDRCNAVEVNGLVKIIHVPDLLVLHSKGLLIHKHYFVDYLEVQERWCRYPVNFLACCSSPPTSSLLH